MVDGQREGGDLGVGGDEGGDAARHGGDEVAGGERGGDREVGRDQEGDAAALAVIDEEPVERAAGVAARADQHMVLRGIGLDRQRRLRDRVAGAGDDDKRVAE